MGFTKEERLERIGEAVSTEVDGTVVILQTEEGTYYQLDGAGKAVWELLDEPTSLEALVAALVTEFEVDETRCRADTEALLGELLDRRLVRPLGVAG
ncbi:MAG: PqqD family protein [Methylacidiphilaceae bacterium]|nr:PqqD family protein [Candidatus Methylacidiphilaceae bacterium]